MWCSNQLIAVCFGCVSLLLIGCNSKVKALKCIGEATGSLRAEQSYQTLLHAFNQRIDSRPVDSSGVVERVAGGNVLFNSDRTKAIAMELEIYDLENGSRNGYGTVYLATLRDDSGWVFVRGDAPNFHLSTRDAQLRERLDSKYLEEHILGRFVDDGLMNKDGCSLNQDYIEGRWAKH